MSSIIYLWSGEINAENERADTKLDFFIRSKIFIRPDTQTQRLTKQMLQLVTIKIDHILTSLRIQAINPEKQIQKRPFPTLFPLIFYLISHNNRIVSKIEIETISIITTIIIVNKPIAQSAQGDI